MAQVCQITGKRPMSGNNVSHSNRRTRRRFMPNLHWHKLWIPSEKRFIKLLVSLQGLRTIDKLGIEQVLIKVGLRKAKKENQGGE
ncbi:MAG: 50S ribosomal protein L28 [Alcanivoracaceae bacterium]|nr:50S ribosomal protein L28 [Alcanivoracaceae bacterium]